MVPFDPNILAFECSNICSYGDKESSGESGHHSSDSADLKNVLLVTKKAQIHDYIKMVSCKALG